MTEGERGSSIIHDRHRAVLNGTVMLKNLTLPKIIIIQIVLIIVKRWGETTKYCSIIDASVIFGRRIFYF